MDDWTSRSRRVWQYRFDDTLAYYFEKREAIAHDKDKAGHRRQALIHIERAWDGAYEDEEIAKHRTHLQSHFGDLHGTT